MDIQECKRLKTQTFTKRHHYRLINPKYPSNLLG